MLILILKAGADRYAIDVARVVELVPRVELRAIPHAPPFLAGLLAYRGNAVPVIDLGILLSRGPCHERLSTRIVLVNDAGGDQGNAAFDAVEENAGRSAATQARSVRLLGLIGEQVSDLVEVGSGQITPPPVQLPQAPFLGAIIHTDEGIVQLLLVERMRERFLLADFPDQEATRSSDPSNADTGLPAFVDSKTDD